MSRLFHSIRYLPLLLVAAAFYARPAHGAPAHFWISLDGAAASDPGVASAPGVMGAARTLHVWAQPHTVGGGAYNALTNDFQSLENVSLDIVSPNSDFTIDPATVTFHNPTYSTTRPRFESVHDATTGLAGTTDASLLKPGFAAGVVGLQGFTIAFDGTEADGLGPSCDPSDNACGMTPTAGPAWLMASVDVIPTANAGALEFYLRVGQNGMNHHGENASATDVRFGVDTMGAAPPLYNADGDKQTVHAHDDPDAVLTLVQPGDYDADGDVDHADYAVWRLSYGGANLAADGNSDGVVDAADYTVWRNNLPKAGSGAGVGVPEPGVIAWMVIWSPLILARRMSKGQQS